MLKELTPRNIMTYHFIRDETLAIKSAFDAIHVRDALPREPEVTWEERLKFGLCSPTSLTALFGPENINMSHAEELVDFDETIKTLEILAERQKLKIIKPHNSSEFIALMRDEETVGAFIGVDETNTNFYQRQEEASMVGITLNPSSPGEGHALAIIPFGSPNKQFGRSYMLVDAEKGFKKAILTDYGVICLYTEASQTYSDEVYEDSSNQRVVFVFCKDTTEI